MLYQLLKPLLFQLPPEVAHNLVIKLAKTSPWSGHLSGINPSSKQQIKVGSIQWNFPIGLAAGLDKNAECLDFFSALGFGAIECGTITLKPQAGNPLPRMFRYPENFSLRNSMGFPNQGLDIIAHRLKEYRGKTPIGANIGKNKDTNAKDSIQELKTILNTIHKDADYFVINVSSPNTPGLRELQEESYLKELFCELIKVSHNKDLYLKIAPDLDNDKIISLAKLCADIKICGIIATNTTIKPELGTGGISGEWLKPRATKVRELLFAQKLPIEIIGVGGFSSFDDLKLFWSLGGKVAQIYTSFVYQGPDLLKDIHQQTLNFLKVNQINSLEDFFKLDLTLRQKLLN